MIDFSDRLALKADQVRVQVLKARRFAKTMTVAQAAAHINWKTEDSLNQRLTVTMSLREAVSLVRVIGPLEDRREAYNIKFGGPTARFLAAIHVVRQAVLRQPEGGLALGIALSVLRVALDDLECQNGTFAPKKSARRR